MKEINWVQSGNSYTAQLQYGKVFISPTEPPNRSGPYTFRAETNAGAVVSTGSYDLETCKACVLYALPLLDQISGEFAECGNVNETLEICQRLLLHENEAAHWLRIEHIKAWMARHVEQTYEIVSIPLSSYSPYDLNWTEEGNTFYAEIPHGRAVIEETRHKGIIGGGIRHNATIIHRTGAVLECYAWVDFMEAEWAIKKCLTELEEPYIDKVHRDYMRFTFDICKRLLPEDTDLIHYVRLDILATHISLAV